MVSTAYKFATCLLKSLALPDCNPPMKCHLISLGSSCDLAINSEHNFHQNDVLLLNIEPLYLRKVSFRNSHQIDFWIKGLNLL